MRTQHTGHTFEGFPVNSATFISDDQLVLGGGGGASRSGVKNRLVRDHLENCEYLAVLTRLISAFISLRGTRNSILSMNLSSVGRKMHP
jgi:hypothetical protein